MAGADDEVEDMGDEEYPSASSVLFDDFADEALAAVKSGDKAAFRTALKGAIKACYEEE